MSTNNPSTDVETEYYFAIGGRQSEAYSEEKARQLIELQVVQRDTPAWRTGMKCWGTAGKIPELADCFAAADPEPRQSRTPPPLSGESSGATPSPRNPQPTGVEGHNASSLQEWCKKIVYFLFRPQGDRPSRVRAYVDEKPSRSVPIAIALLAGIGLLVISPFFTAPETPADNLQNAAGQQTPQSLFGGPNGAERWRIIRNGQQGAQRYIDQGIETNQDSFSRQYDTYRDGTYDWSSGNRDRD